MIIETDRLTLAELQIEDAPFILELYNDPDFIKFIGDRGIGSLSNAEQFIETGPRASYAEHGHGLYLVQLKDGTSIGICGILKRDNLDDPDIGFAMLPEFRKNGYTFEAAQAAIDDGRNRLGLQRIVAIASPDNNASIRLLEKMGMRFIKKINNQNSDQINHLYTLI
ncbi:MAG: GNAT family N-acetyltransferase [Candidatus Marinimicrobia bacterium]|jgi:[ribosomal protein S5]-alanine N-acetyltransferase|nr:GNAT family N-acetyltransferase [Candidatus Neomarinimicrobiota bacterium]MBT5777081.1 GNAT family N-acetyltransferase [Candidatus Neomarinimicrobiota bacterium]MBT5996601.1 GNAT family N-acetyltransferase [Candidatus Neomarinimicrobiota bacterium]MBT6390487.1 GNAT family N-acetyltransferase [Candidatus Neomarinimicrobiota bacterium]MBT6782721.1 GNAT family N-acetyltransferase [Candidatus Neomarinimicrobiota bacterium]